MEIQDLLFNIRMRESQQLSEKLGPLGSGAARADQQIARQNVVERLAFAAVNEQQNQIEE